MSAAVYLDPSVIVALFTDDPFSDRATAYLASASRSVLVSDLAAAEFASALALHVRTSRLSEDNARRAFSNFDVWSARLAEPVSIEPSDVRVAEATIRRLDFALRTLDAIHIAIAVRLGASLATFDAKQAHAAQALGADLAPI